MSNALGLLEFISIAKGLEAADAMVKAADVRLSECQTICPGKFIVIVSGQISAVQSAIVAGKEVGRQDVINELTIANIHPEVLTGIYGLTSKPQLGAVGVLEFFSVASVIEAADAAAKAAAVQILDVRLAMGIGGKSFVVVTGELSSVKASVSAAREAGRRGGMLIHYAVIPSPTPALFNKLI